MKIFKSRQMNMEYNLAPTTDPCGTPHTKAVV